MRQILDTLRIQVLSRKNALFSVHKWCLLYNAFKIYNYKVSNISADFQNHQKEEIERNATILTRLQSLQLQVSYLLNHVFRQFLKNVAIKNYSWSDNKRYKDKSTSRFFNIVRAWKHTKYGKNRWTEYCQGLHFMLYTFFIKL